MHRLPARLALLAALTGLGAFGCDTAPATNEPVVTPRGAAPAVTPAPPALRRLTQAQYTNAVTDLLGAGLLLPSSLEPDTALEGLYSVGAAATAISPVGVELYEEAAFSLAEQVGADPARAAAVYGCEPTEAGCLRAFVETFGRRAWRRPLSEEEVAAVVSLGEAASTTLGDAGAGQVYALAALLQSPAFLYRIELGEPDPNDATQRRYTSEEMATRLAFFLWNTTPDDALLTAAEAGLLVTEAGLAAEVERMLADPRARQGVRTFFDEMLELYGLEDLSKDPTLFTHMSPEIAVSAREETLLGLDAIVESDADWRTFLTTRQTFLDPVLAALYNVRAPTREGFAATELDAASGRAGFLGHASFLALQAHPTSSSATLRGAFIRDVLLCQEIPPPPADVDASIPEADTTSPTLRDRLATHLTDPTCAGCHQLTDPIGLGLENFDGIGAWRVTENGAMIDPSGVLDGAAFDDAAGLGAALAEHPSLGPCLSRTMYRYATARSVEDGEKAIVAWHAAGLEESGYRVRALLADIAMSPGFRAVGAVE